MENTEIMNEAMDAMIEDVVVEEVVGKANKMNLVLKGGLVAAAVAVAAVLAKKGYDAYKAKKALRQPDNEIDVDAEDVEEVVVE
jgi:hypothetical protein